MFKRPIRSKKTIWIAAMVFLLLLTGSTAAFAKPYGAWTMKLYSSFCTGSAWEKWGCKGYLFYRLDWDRTRSGANSACIRSCNSQTPNANANAKAACLRGCQNALSQEK